MSYQHLTKEERKKIAQRRKEKQSIRRIAQELGRSASTISREIKRNSVPIQKTNPALTYRPKVAQEKYRKRRGSRGSRKLDHKQLTDYIQEKLLETWSPEQIAGRLKLDYPETRQMRVSHSSIYRWLRQGLMRQAAALRMNLRHYGHRHGETRGRFNGVRELRERSREALRRKRLGDWEVDTIVSSDATKKACLLSVCDRKSRYCGLVLLKRRSAPEVLRGFHFLFDSGTLPLTTMTADRGTEFACYKDVEAQLQIPFYFCRPRSPWQKPSVENQNGLIRQFFPKGTNFSEISPHQAASVMTILNNRPRKSLGFKTPAEVLHFA